MQRGHGYDARVSNAHAPLLPLEVMTMAVPHASGTIDRPPQPAMAGGTRWASILDAIGNTPLINVEGVWVKCEFLNPSGSIKARLAKYAIERAETEGRLKPGDTIVEASSGNTGNALSMVAAFHVTEALAKARELAARPGYFCPMQFESEWNVEENRTWLGPEILSQLPSGVVPDALVVGVGTGGTLVGVGQAFREVNPHVRLFGVEPDESCTILCGETGRHSIEGIADGFIPGIVARHRALIDDVVAVRSDEAIACMRRLARNHGMFVGPSSGAHLVAAQRLKEAYPELQTVVTTFSDEGEKYLSEHFSAAVTDAVPLPS